MIPLLMAGIACSGSFMIQSSVSSAAMKFISYSSHNELIEYPLYYTVLIVFLRIAYFKKTVLTSLYYIPVRQYYVMIQVKEDV